ncbi:MAG TPA: hypothetical protein VER58_13940 [Thermoanaerobaculia bacterium]|nr:hypothetical protein [Thermoanaerobaculia bacterium]
MAKFKAKVMSADYRGDLPELARLRDELAQWPKDRELAFLARYWGGFASWRIAMNGANHQMPKEEQVVNLKNAASEFYRAMQAKDDFADAYAAAAGVNGWLANTYNGPTPDRPSMMERVYLAYALLTKATTLEPTNPRVLWIKGGFIQYAPGGSVERAIATYKQQRDEAERRGVDPASPLPDWGKPEALMSLANAHSLQTPPDLATAREEANEALKIVPDWSYVRDTLIPRIDQKMSPQVH